MGTGSLATGQFPTVVSEQVRQVSRGAAGAQKSKRHSQHTTHHHLMTIRGPWLVNLVQNGDGQ